MKNRKSKLKDKVAGVTKEIGLFNDISQDKRDTLKEIALNLLRPHMLSDELPNLKVSVATSPSDELCCKLHKEGEVVTWDEGYTTIDLYHYPLPNIQMFTTAGGAVSDAKGRMMQIWANSKSVFFT